MTGLQNLLGRFVGRSSVALVLVAAVVAWAPVAPFASATPEGDADAAITQVWDADGGATGPLGAKDGGVYPVGSGFGQNFAGGRIYFTPETGAHIMQGAILDKYLSLGGPTDGDLGFPNIDEGAGRAPDSRNTTFSAADKPVIFFTPDTGAHVVRGAINAAWDKLGGSAGVLGVPTEDEVYRGDVVSQAFTGGQLSWNRRTKTFTTTPPELADQLKGLAIPGDATSAINAARRAAGGPLGPLGAAEGPPESVGDGGLVQNFAGGKIFYSPATGANVITGQMLAKYESVGGPKGDLGFPIGSEADGGIAPASRIATFAAADKPVIFWTPDFGAVIVRGAMNAAWSKLGGATGDLGAPTADQTENGDVVTQKFTNGAISFDRATNEFSTEPPNLANNLAGLEVPGLESPKAPQAAEPGRDDSGEQVVQEVVVAAGHRAGAAAGGCRRCCGDPESASSLTTASRWTGSTTITTYAERRRRGDHDDDHDEGGALRVRPDALVGSSSVDQHRPYVPLSAWAMPGDDTESEPAGPASPDVPAERAPDGGFLDDQDAIDTAPNRILSVVADPQAAADEGDTDEDDLGVTDEDDDHGERRPRRRTTGTTSKSDRDHIDEADAVIDDVADVEPVTTVVPVAEHVDEPESGPPSGRHAAIRIDEPAPAQTSLRLASDDSDAPRDIRSRRTPRRGCTGCRQRTVRRVQGRDLVRQ